MKRFGDVMWIWGNNISTSWGRVPNITLWMRFTCWPNLMLLASPWLEIYRLSNWSFEHIKIVDSHFSDFGQLKIDPTYLFLWLWASDSNFTVWRQDRPSKTIQTLSVWLKVKEPCRGFNWQQSRTGWVPN